MLELERLFPTIEELVMLYFPSGAESDRRPGSECDRRSWEQCAIPNSRRQSPKVDRHYRSQKI